MSGQAPAGFLSVTRNYTGADDHLRLQIGVKCICAIALMVPGLANVPKGDHKLWESLVVRGTDALLHCCPRHLVLSVTLREVLTDHLVLNAQDLMG